MPGHCKWNYGWGAIFIFYTEYALYELLLA